MSGISGPVDNADLAPMPEGTTKGRLDGSGTGEPQNLTAAEMRGNVDQPHVSASAPTTGDNAAAGYADGDLWYDSLSNVMWRCDDAATGTWRPVVCELSTSAPTVNDDYTKGFAFGSLWYEAGTEYRLWICTSPVPVGSADWRSFVKTTVAAAAPTVNNDSTCGYSTGDGWLDTTTAPPIFYRCHSNANAAADWQPDRGTVPFADPGDTKAIPVHRGVSVQLSTGGSLETRTMDGPSFDGQRMLLFLRSHGGGNCEITSTVAINAAGNTKITFTAAGQVVELVGINDGGTPRWHTASNDGATLS